MDRFDLSELKKDAHIHFIGIGGVSMSGLAQMMLNDAFKVSGSDRASTAVTEKLKESGAEIFLGHDAKNVDGADLVVHTAAVHEDNPEMKAAREKGIRTIDRAEFLGAVMKRYRHAVGVAGTHGKTTTTSMLAYALCHADADPTISVGGNLDLIGGNVRIGGSDLFVTEACEYTNSFLKFYPTVALLTNIEEDHLDFFSGLDEIIESFRKFAELAQTVIACGDDKNVIKALENESMDIICYGMSEKFDYYPKNIEYINGCPCFDIYFRGEFLCKMHLRVPGEHNIKNAIAAIAVTRVLGIDTNLAAEGLEAYEGVHRRFEKKGEYNGAEIMDDYAHHPTEIKATIEAASKRGGKRIVCVFQPHTYSRTRTLWDEFVSAFDGVDELVLVDIFPAREVFDGKTRSCDLADEIAKRGNCVRYIESFDKACRYFKETLSKGDIFFTMGAGDVYKIGDMLLEE